MVLVEIADFRTTRAAICGAVENKSGVPFIVKRYTLCVYVCATLMDLEVRPWHPRDPDYGSARREFIHFC